MCDTWIVDTLETAFELAAGAGRGCRFVTLQGELVDSDGTCPECRAGLEQFCPNLTLTYNAPDKHLAGVTYGGYSDSIVVDERFVLRVPSNLDLAGLCGEFERQVKIVRSWSRLLNGLTRASS